MSLQFKLSEKKIVYSRVVGNILNFFEGFGGMYSAFDFIYKPLYALSAFQLMSFLVNKNFDYEEKDQELSKSESSVAPIDKTAEEVQAEFKKMASKGAFDDKFYKSQIDQLKKR